MRPLPDRPTTAPELRAAGWSGSNVRTSVRRGELRRLRQGVFGSPGDVHAADVHRTAALAAARSCPRAVPSHAAAAVLTGIPVLDLPRPPCLTVPTGTALRYLVDAHLHRASLPSEHLEVVDGVLLTSPARTVIDLAREQGPAAGVVAGDHVLHAGLATYDDLRSVAVLCTRWPGIRNAGRALALFDPAAESPLESLSRLRLQASDLPAFRTQPTVYDRAGRFIARLDFLWDEAGVAGEADGMGKYSGPEDLEREKTRQDALSELGIRTVRWRWRDLRSFDAVVMRLRRRIAVAPTHRDWRIGPTP